MYLYISHAADSDSKRVTMSTPEMRSSTRATTDFPHAAVPRRIAAASPSEPAVGSSYEGKTEVD